MNAVISDSIYPKIYFEKKNLGKAFFLSLDLRKTIFPRFDALYGTFFWLFMDRVP